MFISYAQNFEDVMLRRALGHIERGFYIDVGAWSADTDSVTRLFYDAGWCGVNIEPLPAMLAELQARRPRDVNIGVAVSDCVSTAQLHNIEETGLSTLHKGYAARARNRIGSATVHEVQVTTLAHVWEQHVPPDQPVHFLKVDVEGLEEQVIRGGDWTRHRPWVVVVEATLPQDPTPNHQSWEPMLRAAGYDFVWFDGLNRFYLAAEHADLARAFQTPPNVFDDFKLSNVVELERKLIAAHQQIVDLQAELAGKMQAKQQRLIFPMMLRAARAGVEAVLQRVLPRKVARLIGVPPSPQEVASGLSPDAARVARQIAALRSRLPEE